MIIFNKTKVINMKINYIFLFALFYCLSVCFNLHAVEDISGNWLLDEGSSDEFNTVSKALNKSIKKARRKAESENQKFDNGPKPRSRNRYDSQVRATEAQIKDSSAVKYWGGPETQNLIFQTDVIKFYVGRKIVVLYGGSQKRILKINPSGRAYSYSGTEVTDDYVGRTLAYFEEEALVAETTGTTGIEFSEKYYVDEETGQLVQLLQIDDARDDHTLNMARYFNRKEK
jgi:hypothetical protein